MASLDDILNAYAAKQPNPATQANPNYVEPTPGTPAATLSSANLTDKLQRVADASRSKIASLDAARAQLASQTGAFDQAQAADAKSWVNQLGLDPNSLTGEAVNLGASLVAGGSRQLVGAVASLPSSLAAGAADASLNKQDTDAYNRYVQGVATPADIQHLNSKKNTTGSLPDGTHLSGFAAAKAGATADDSLTVLQLAQQANESRATARKINDFFDISSIEHGGNKRELDANLGEHFRTGADKIAQGWEAGKGKDYAGAAKGIASGVADLLAGAGSAIVDNPKAVGEYVAENAPQLLVGTFGTTGKIAMSAANVGYAADYYQQGIEHYAKQNGGQMPSPEDRRSIAGWASSLALAEELGDKIGLHAMKLGGEGAHVAAGVGRSIKGTAAATLEGAIGETLTEGYQGYAEDVTSGKRAYNDLGRDTWSNIYNNAVIGGLSGAALSGGAHGVHELTGTTEAHAEDAKQAATTKETFDAAVTNNTPEVFLDPTEKSYSPSLALGVLFQQNQGEATTMESRLDNVSRAQDIMSKMEDRGQELREQLKSDNKEEVKAARTELTALNKHFDSAQKVMDQISDEYFSSIAPENVKEQVEQANAPATEGNTDAVNSVINLSMASTDHLTADQADQLASNVDNGLNDQQRDYLRAFSEARQAENKLSTMNKVSQEVLYGSAANVGISQYRQRIGAALQLNDQARAEKQLGMLGAFATAQQDKATAARQALAQGLGTQIVKTESTGWKVVPAGTYTKAELDKNGGLAINSGRLVANIGTEAKALASTHAEMTKAVGIRFASQGVATQQAAAVQSSQAAPTPATATPLPSAKPQATAQQTSQEINKLPQETGKASARLEEENLKDVAEKPQSKGEIENISEENTRADAANAAIQAALNDASEEEKAPRKQEAAEQQAAAPAKAPVAEAATAQREAAKEEQADPIGLDTARTPKGETRDYQKRNLIADFFTQQAGSEKVTQRPLASVKDFLSGVVNDTASVFDFLKQNGLEDLTEAQTAAIQGFVNAATAWFGTIQKNMTKTRTKKDGTVVELDPDFYHNDLMQFFINEHGDAAENVKTAISYAAFSWVAENASRSLLNTPEEIAAILNLGEDEHVDPKVAARLARIGARESVVVNALGQRAVQALGLKASRNAPVNLQPQLESAIGAHAMKLLVDRGIVTRTIITGAEMAAMTGSTATKDTAQFKFLALTRGEDGKLSTKGENIAAAVRGSKGVLDKLFSVEPSLKEPAAEPVPFVQKTTRNTDQLVPKALAEIVERENAAEHKLNQDMWNLVRDMPRDLVLGMAGVESTDGKHIANRDGLQAKNDGLGREYDNMVAFFGDMPVNQSMYFEHSVWKQQRVGIATNMINPQTSKIHRHMIYRPSWESTISLKDSAAVDNFMLRVAEGLGVKTDKQANDKSLIDVRAKLAAPEIKAAVAALRQSITKGSISEEQQKAVAAGVDKGGENFHTLAVLVGLARYAEAKATKQDSFKTQMMGEVDGVTNGPMLSHLLAGAAQTVGGLFDLLNKGGFYQLGSDTTNYNLWRSVPGHFDLYETTTGHMVTALNGLAIPVETLNALYTFTGALTEGDKVVKAGRDIIKTPLTAMVFGSSVKSAVDSMADRFIEQIYSTMEDVAAGKGKVTREQVLTSLTKLGVQVAPNMTSEQMLETLLDKSDVGILKEAFKSTIGQAVEETMSADFQTFLDQRTQFNNTAQLAFEVSNAAVSALREAYIADLIEKGEIATRTTKDGKTVTLHDLTVAQEAEFAKQTKDLLPIMQTTFSAESGQLDAGLLASKSDRKLSDRAGYTNEVQFGQSFADNGAKSVGTHAYERVSTSPGVAMAPMSIHSADSGVSHRARKKVSALNIHDALGAGVNGLAATANALNQATWETMLTYSPASQMADTLMRVVHGAAALVKDGKLPAGVAESIAQALATYAEKQKVPAQSVLDLSVILAKGAARTADDMKLQAMEQMGAIDQYALQGGHYEVTDEDRAAATVAREKLTDELTAEDKAALDTLAGALKDALASAGKPVPKAPIKAKPGKPAVQSENALVTFFKAGNVRSITEVAAQLGKMGLSGFESKLLASMVKVLGDKATAYTVRYVTESTPANEILEQPKVPSHAWFVSRDGKNEIYVLASAFKDSGLTKETLLHEMVHATVARTIANEQQASEENGAYTSDALELVEELNRLMDRVSSEVGERGLTQFYPAVENIQEFVAWGMTNSQFQEVLKTVTMQSTTQQNSLLSGLKAFIDTLVGLVFGKKNPSASNGMEVLISNVAGLFKAAAQQRMDSNVVINQSMATNVSDLTTSDLYDALGQVGNTQVSPAFDEHLRGLLDTVVDAIHGPYGAFKASTNAALQNPLDVWANAKVTGVAPFAAESLVSGFRFSEQEAFLAEQVEAAMRTVLEDKDGTTTAAYRELVRLYDAAKEKLTPADFPSQAAYDFVFDIKLGADGKSNYLARFAALGMANEQFNGLLQFQTEIKSGSLAGLSIGEKVNALFERVMTYIHGKLTNTYEGQIANESLTTLVNQLTNIESKKRLKLSQSPLVMIDSIENTFREVATAARAGAAKVGQSTLFKNSTNGFVKLTGRIVTTVASNRVDQLMDALQTFRDAHFKERNGIMMGIVNETRGVTPAIAMFHKLLRVSKHVEGERKDLITNTTQFVMESFKDGGEYLTKEMKAAVSAVLLRTDVATLLSSANYDMAGIQKLVEDKSHLASQISLFEAELRQFGSNALAYSNLSRTLAYYKATGHVAGEHLLMNAGNIAALYGTQQAGRVSQQDQRAAAEIIDQLVSLYALSYTDPKVRAQATEVMKEEAGRGRANGVEMVLKLHAQLQQQSADRLFNTSGPLQMKGYLPEVYNPYIQVRVADEQLGDDLIEQGYTAGESVIADEADPDAKGAAEQRIYSIRDGGLTQHLTGIFSYTGQRAKGTRTHNGDLNIMSVNGLENRAKMSDIRAGKAAGMQDMFTKTMDPTRTKGKNFLAPVLNSQGEVVNYRYLMTEATKDAVLERDNRFDQLLGIMAGNIYDKETTASQNRIAVQALRDQYEADFATNAKSYTRVGPNSTDPEMRDIWRLLPEATKQSIREVWGGNNMMVRYDLLDINFGYRKLSMTDPFGVPEADRNRFEKLYVEVFNGLFGKKAELRLAQFEDVWQALVREAKDTMVVKSGMTLLGNFTSNVSELIWFGVPMTDIVRNHRVALKGVMAHRKDSTELARLQIQLDTGHLQSGTRAEIDRRVAQLKDSMSRNPVKQLIDAGLMPSIVEDVANEEDQYSFKGKLTRKVDDFLGNLNPHVLQAGKFLTMAHDTPIYQALSYATQVSDFLARYTLYQHVINRAENKLAGETAVQLVSDAFVNYDVPSHRGVQYANDMGLVYFSKYYLRIQKVIALLYRQNPGRALMLLTAGHFLDFIPMLQHSSALHRFGNPFSMGALESLKSLDEMATLNALMTPFR